MSKMSVNFNPAAEYAANKLAEVERRLEKETERLSSGQQINSAEDDATGFAVREKMRADVAVLKQGLENVQQGASLVQTAEGAMGSVVNILTRMKELATQAASANVNSDRSAIQEEFSQLASEVDRIANGTEFNGKKLLDNSLAATGVRIHFGTGNSSGSDYFYLAFGGARLQDLGLASASVASQTSAQQALDGIDGAIDTLNQQVAKVGAYQNRLESVQANLQVTVDNLQASDSAISDTDMAQAMVELTRDQVLSQASVATLAQANNLPGQAISLLLGK
jgi:flagellin